jgi:TatD DNase family protein
MHCYTGTKEFAYKLLTLNSYFSASGIITFNNSVDLQNTFKVIPNNKLLIETDSPYLSPVPYRGKKNEPSFIKHTLEKLSKIKDIDLNKIEEITNVNFNSLFNLN